MCVIGGKFSPETDNRMLPSFHFLILLLDKLSKECRCDITIEWSPRIRLFLDKILLPLFFIVLIYLNILDVLIDVGYRLQNKPLILKMFLSAGHHFSPDEVL